MLFDEIAIIGVGLIGGSVGLAAKAKGVARTVVGMGRDAANLDKARQLGAIDRGTTDLPEAVRKADLIVVCTPADRIASTILKAAPHCQRNAIFTDGGSTKEQIVLALKKAPTAGLVYVPAHPLAGSEKNGVENARADLFEGRLTILTPTNTTDAAALERVDAFWRSLGSRVTHLDPGKHDRVLAGTSHLPHAVASALAGTIPMEWLQYSAGGLRDTTRVAGGDPELWAAILLENNPATRLALDAFRVRLDELRELLEAKNRDGLIQWLSQGKQVRDALGT